MSAMLVMLLAAGCRGSWWTTAAAAGAACSHDGNCSSKYTWSVRVQEFIIDRPLTYTYNISYMIWYWLFFTLKSHIAVRTCSPRRPIHVPLGSGCRRSPRLSRRVTSSAIFPPKDMEQSSPCQPYFSSAEPSSEASLCTQLLDYATVYLAWTRTARTDWAVLLQSLWSAGAQWYISSWTVTVCADSQLLSVPCVCVCVCVCLRVCVCVCVCVQSVRTVEDRIKRSDCIWILVVVSFA